LPAAALLSTLAHLDRAVPIIYTGTTARAGDARGGRLGLGARLIALGVAIACLSVLTLASRLPPNPAGVGSHRGLGLAGCQFLDSTGLPCPSCGMTTSFAWFAHGNLVASVYVQPMGAALAVIAAACVWGGLYVALSGRPVYRLLRLLPGRYYLLPLLALAVLAWGWKILIHLNGLDGWR
jgi:hypothetical protein